MRLFKSLSICFGLLVAACVPVTAANTFSYGTSEVELYRTDFSSPFDSTSWDFGGTTVGNDIHKASTGSQWQRSYYNFAGSGYDLDDGELNFYWSSKTDRSKRGDSALYFELNFTENRNNLGNTPSNFEESSIKFQLTPTSNNPIYQLYYDPAFCIGSTSNPCAVTELPQAIQDMKTQQGSLFTSISTYESFRLQAKKRADNTLEFTPFYWSTTNNQWMQFWYKQQGANFNTPVSLILNTTQSPTNKYIQGLDSFQSLGFQFRKDFPAVDAVAVTRIPNPNANRVAASKTPEPASVLGLLAIGTIGVVSKNRKK